MSRAPEVLLTHRMLALLLLAGTLVSVSSPGSAQAASVTMTPVTAVPEDTATVLTFTGQADKSSSVIVKWRVAGGQPCAVGSSQDSGDTILEKTVSAGPYTLTTTVRPTVAPNQVLICMFVQSGSYSDPAVASDNTVLNVRQPNSTLSVVPPTAPAWNSQVQFTANVQTEVSRRLLVKVKPAGGTPCGAAYKVDNGDELMDRTVEGGPKAEVDTFRAGAPGGYVMCGYVQEGGDDEVPELTATASFTVPRVRTSTRVRVRSYKRYVWVSGSLSGAPYGSSVVLQKRVGSSWRRLKSLEVSDNKFGVSLRLKRSAQVRARYAGTSQYASSTSGSVYVPRRR